jgi:L-rhamnose mutarotase
MRRYACTIDLKNDPATIAGYDEHHRAVWPEVEAGLRDIGIDRMYIWRLDRRLFMLVEAGDEFDWGRDFARYAARGGRIAEWQAMMESFQQPVPGAKPGEWWAQMKLVYALE